MTGVRIIFFPIFKEKVAKHVENKYSKQIIHFIIQREAYKNKEGYLVASETLFLELLFTL
jgi:hypothetical protein